MIVGAALLVFSAAFDVIDHTLLLKITGLESYLSNTTQCSSLEASLTADMYSAVFLRAVALVHYSSLFLQMICHLSYKKLK